MNLGWVEKTWKALFISIRQKILVLNLRVWEILKKMLPGLSFYFLKLHLTQRPNKAGVGSCFADDSEFSDKFKD